MGTIAYLLSTAMRDFVRYTGDGLPNEPAGRPLPVGDPASGQHNPPKKLVRDAFLAIAETADNLTETAQSVAADRVQTGQDRAASEVAAALSATSREQAQVAAIAAGAPIVTTLTSPTPVDQTVEILQTDVGAQVWQVNVDEWAIVGWLTPPLFETFTQMSQALGSINGQTAMVKAGSNTEREDFVYIEGIDQTLSAFVVASDDGGQWLSKRKSFVDDAEFEADTRGYGVLNAGDRLYIDGRAVLVVASDEVEYDRETPAGLRVRWTDCFQYTA